MKFLQWGLESMADGTFPSIGHDGGALGEMRASLALAPLEYVGAAVFLKCDFLELSSTLGLTSVNNALHSCPFCTFTGDQQGVSGRQRVKPAETTSTKPAEYRSSCERAEIWEALENDQMLAVRAKRRNDRQGAERERH